MALKKKAVTGMKDIMPGEMEIRDYVIGLIKDTYRTFGFSSIETPCVEHIENLCSKQGGDNEKLTPTRSRTITSWKAQSLSPASRRTRRTRSTSSTG